MRARIDLRFRPSLIIFLDETGAQICDQLQIIARFTGFDPVLCQSVALLKVDSASQRATPVPLNGTFADQYTPQQEDKLETLIEHALKDVQNNQRIQRIIEAGYPIPNTRTQIFIVGDAHSAELAKILKLVRTRLRRSGFATLICYVINAYRLRQLTGPLENDLALLDTEQSSSYWNERHVPDFCYLYEDMLTYPMPAFLHEPVSQYITAEAIFALIATSLSTEPFFQNQMQISTPFNTYENIGSLSTCLIVFPHAHVLEYCSAKLGVALMEQWQRDLRHQSTSEAELRKLQRDAVTTVRKIRGWIEDSVERPFANGPERRWGTRKRSPEIEKPSYQPNLNILLQASGLSKNELAAASLTLTEQKALSHSQQSVHRTLQEETEALFQLFWPEDIWEEYRRQKLHLNNWTRLVFRRSNRAVEAYADWEKRATRAWETVATRILAEARALIDHLWSKDQNGFEMATAYVDELNEHLAKLANDQGHWREEHENNYQQFLETFERVAEGEWVVPENTGANGTGQARPTMNNQRINPQQGNNPTQASSSDNTGPIIGTGPTPTRPSQQHLPDREERLTQRLEQRIDWHQERIPSIATQAVIALPFIITLVLVALAWISPTILNIVIVSAISTVLVGAAHWYFRSMYTKRVEERREDLLIFYRRYYAYRCEHQEDRLRITVLGPLRRAVQTVSEHLNNISFFIKQTQDELNERTQQIQNELFDKPAGLRDIFVANGERLQKENRNTLEDFAGQISKMRMKEPLEEWHRSPEDLKRQLIQRFRQQSKSLMEMDDQQTLEHIREFATEVTKAYFRGPLIDLQSALDKQDIWTEALDRVENPLYQAQVGVKEPQFLFVCGREHDMSKGLRYIPTHAHPMKLSDTHEWVLMAAFFRGGLPTTISPEILFPEKALLPDQTVVEPEDTVVGGYSDDDDDDIHINADKVPASPSGNTEDDKLFYSA